MRMIRTVRNRIIAKLRIWLVYTERDSLKHIPYKKRSQRSRDAAGGKMHVRMRPTTFWPPTCRQWTNMVRWCIRLIELWRFDSACDHTVSARNLSTDRDTIQTSLSTAVLTHGKNQRSSAFFIHTHMHIQQVHINTIQKGRRDGLTLNCGSTDTLSKPTISLFMCHVQRRTCAAGVVDTRLSHSPNPLEHNLYDYY